MSHFAYGSINSSNEIMQLFTPADGDEAHLTSLLPASQTLVPITGDMPEGCHCYLYDAASGTVIDDSAKSAVCAAKIKREALVPLYETRAAIVAANSAQSSLDFSEELAAIDARIAAVVA